MAPANESKSGGKYEGIQTRLLIGHKHNRENEHFNGPRSITIQACPTRLSRFLQQKPRADSAIKYTSRPLSSVGIGSQGSEQGSQVDILVEKKYIQVEEGGERSWGLVFNDEIAAQTGLN